ncbi:hypothetical protein CIB48_g11985, partial [Xylaria polymorpha]
MDTEVHLGDAARIDTGAIAVEEEYDMEAHLPQVRCFVGGSASSTVASGQSVGGGVGTTTPSTFTFTFTFTLNQHLQTPLYIMESLRQTFKRCKAENRAALVTYVTAGFPKPELMPGILLAMQKGGADVIELGVPFTDPIADGPTIQTSNTVALANGVTIQSTLQMIKDSRVQGLTVPVLLMGYYNPLLSYGEEALLNDCKAAGVNGFIVCDLPPEEAVSFRKFCSSGGLSYVPLIAPATSEARMKLLCALADSFIYVVSRQGVTGALGTLNANLPDLLGRVKKYSGDKPAAVGFGVSTREHFQSVAAIADGVVIGSQIVT